MPQIENVTQINIRMPQGGHPNGVKHARKKGGNGGIQAPLSKGNEKRKEGHTGRIHKADRLPPEISRPIVRRKTGKTGHGLHERQAGKNQAGEEAACQPKRETGLHRRGYQRPAPGLDVLLVQMREDTRPAYAAADGVYRPLAGLRHHRGNRGKAQKDKPRVHRPLPQKRQGGPQAEREKPHETPGFPEKPHPRPHLLHQRGAQEARFLANRHRSPLWPDHSGPVPAYIDRYRRCFRLDRTTRPAQ